MMTTLGAPTIAAVLRHDHGVLAVGTNARDAGRPALLRDVSHTAHLARQPGEPRPIDRGGADRPHDRHRNGCGQP